jgi:hypothetical protein
MTRTEHVMCGDMADLVTDAVAGVRWADVVTDADASAAQRWLQCRTPMDIHTMREIQLVYATLNVMCTKYMSTCFKYCSFALK